MSKNIIFAGDGLHNQFLMQVIALSNFWGKTTNIAFPVGENIWNNPQLGIGNLFLAWLFSNFFLLQSSQILIVLMIVGGVLNIFGLYLLSSSLNIDSYFRFLFIALGSLTPFYFDKFEHLAISQYYLLPIFLFILIRYFNDDYKKRNLLLLLLSVSLVSGIWWILVLLYLSMTIFLINLVQLCFRKKSTEKKSLIFYAFSSLIFITSLLPSFILLYFSRQTIGESRFSSWQSEIFGGKLSDLLVGSNIVNKLLPSLQEKISPALSSELQLLGLPLIFFVIYFLYRILSLPFAINSSTNQSEVQLTQLGIVTFFYYLVGGFGNLQSTFLNLFGITPPARAWSRLVIFLSIIGMYLAFKTFFTFKRGRSARLLMLVILLASLTESYLTKPLNFTELEKVGQYPAVIFLSENVKKCPVLQIPIDTVPIPQDFRNENNDRYYYSGYIPFLIEPNLKWSFGSWTHSEGWYYSAIVPSQVTKKWVTLESEIPYCALLFDKDFATWRGQNGDEWPGLSIEGWNPSYSDARYQVFLVDTL